MSSANKPYYLNVVDANEWDMLTGAWRHDPDGTIQLPAERAEEHLAFHRSHCFQDAEVRFEFCPVASFSDTGIILRAQDAQHYYVVHFPFVGQIHRARYFWVAVSKVDNAAGWTRQLRLAELPGVQCELDAWHDVVASIVGDEIRVSVDGRHFDPVRDSTFRESGRIGLMGFTLAPGMYGPQIRNLRVAGEPSPAKAWDSSIRPGKNWFAIFPTGHWQRMPALTRAANGRLLMFISQMEATPIIVESADNGRTWTLLADLGKRFEWRGENAHGGVVHCTRGGKLLLLLTDYRRRHIFVCRSTDHGKTWSDPQQAQMPELPESIGCLYPYNPLVESQSGALLWSAQSDLASALGNSEDLFYKHQAERIAYVLRSTDHGESWTPIEMIGPRGKGMAPLEDGGSEINLAQLPSGEILALNRPEFSKTMWEMRSRDDGLTWSRPVRSGVAGCAASLICTQRGDLLTGHRFPGNGVNLSRDGGLNWDAGTRVGTDVWVQGVMHEVEPDLVFYAYMDSWEGPLRGQFLRVTPAGLMPAT